MTALDEQKIIHLAEDLGFAHAAFVNTSQIVFVPSFRPLCAENVCGKYGANYACPPDCGTVEEMAERIQQYKRALVLQTMWDIQDPMNEKETKPAKGSHNHMTLELRKKMEFPTLMVGAGGCDLCSPCAITEKKPCRFPAQRFSCMSAYCIFVRELCTRCGMEYDGGSGVVSFFSMICF